MSLRQALHARQKAFFAWRDDPSQREALEAAMRAVDREIARLLKEAAEDVALPDGTDAAPLRPEEELEAVDQMFEAIEGDEADFWNEDGLGWLLRIQATQAQLRRDLEAREQQATRPESRRRGDGAPATPKSAKRPAGRGAGPRRRKAKRSPGGRGSRRARPPAEVAMAPEAEESTERTASVGPTAFVAPEADEESAPPADSETAPVQRTPHLELDTDQVTADQSFEVEVWADTEAARAGEESEDVVIHAPASIERFDLKVWLITSEHFEVTATPDRPLTIERSEPKSNTLVFEVRVKSEAELSKLHEEGDVASPEQGFVRAVFHYEGQPSGKVTRRLAIGSHPEPASGEDDPESDPLPPTIVAVAGAATPDLLIQVEADPDEPDRRFSCLVTAKGVEVGEEERIATWVLSRSAGDLVDGLMNEFTAKGKANTQRLAALRGAGAELWSALPRNVREVYWRMVDAGTPPKTVSIVTEEPYFPWELVVAHRVTETGARERRDPLGVEAAVGRWLRRDGVAARQRISLSDSLVVAPDYPGKRKLKHAADEARRVGELFAGHAPSPVSFDALDAALKANAASLVHFACHGKDSDHAQAIFLEDDQSLSSTEVQGMDGFQSALAEARPLVFLNACEVGRLAPSLAGVGGFASSFINLGASAVVAALWSVKDTVAHEVAMAFYQELAERPETPFSEILRTLRARAYEGDTAGEDSYGAYCFYGDPLASRE